MEKNSYDFYTFFSEVALAWKYMDTREAEIYTDGDKVWKVFHSFLPENARGEEHLEELSKLNSQYLTVPKRKLYLDQEYYGYLMDFAGTPLDKYWSEYNLTMNEKEYILKSLKEIVIYLRGLGLIHSDIRIPNVFIDDEDEYLHVRLGDINSMIFPDSKGYHLNLLHEEWYNYYHDISVVDKLGFDLITFILINFDAAEVEDIKSSFKRANDQERNGQYFLEEMRHILKYDKGYFRDEEAFFIKRNIANYNKDKRLMLPNTYLIDCLK